jgi:hypothetical protein
MSRIRATFFHFLISCLVGVILFSLFWFVWYPAPMLIAIGGHEIFLLIIGIDVILGPALTLVIFKSGKKYLKYDLLAIVSMQIFAMLYGISTLMEARPVYVAALGDKFQVIQATEVIDANLAKAKTRLPMWGPLWVGTKAPLDKLDVLMAEDMARVGAGRGHLPQLHIPYEDMSEIIVKHAQDISLLEARNPSQAKEIHLWLKKHDCDEISAKYQPIKIGATVFALVIDGRSAKIIGIMPFLLK